MSERVLTPDTLMFESFRHSQGNVGTQIILFRYIELNHGVKPDTHPNADALRRYCAFINGAIRSGSKSHLKHTISSKTPLDPSKAVYAAIKQVREEQRSSFARKVNRENAPTALEHLSLALLWREMELLNTNDPWASFVNGKPYDRQERLRARVCSGRASFLFHYGRDGNHTGYTEFDAMYANIWRVVNSIDTTEQALVDHAEMVARAEHVFAHSKEV